MKTACEISCAAWAFADAAQRDGIDQVDVPFDKRSKGGFGFRRGKFAQQSDVIPFGHSTSNVRQAEKGTEFFRKNGRDSAAHCPYLSNYGGNPMANFIAEYSG